MVGISISRRNAQVELTHVLDIEPTQPSLTEPFDIAATKHQADPRRIEARSP